jgi:hypothetical protein
MFVDPSIREAEARGSELKASLGYKARSSLKNKQINQNNIGLKKKD